MTIRIFVTREGDDQYPRFTVLKEEGDKQEDFETESAYVAIAVYRDWLAQAMGRVLCHCGDGSCMLCDDNGMVDPS